MKYKGILWTEGLWMLSIRALLEDDLQRQEYLHAIRQSYDFSSQVRVLIHWKIEHWVLPNIRKKYKPTKIKGLSDCCQGLHTNDTSLGCGYMQ